MTEILFKELSEGLTSKKFVLIDLRKEEERKESGKLTGSFCLPVQDLPDALSLPKDDFKTKYGFTLPSPTDVEGTSQLVWYCRSGRRVGVAEESLKAKGYKGHRLYFGSILDWIEKGGEVERMDEKGGKVEEMDEKRGEVERIDEKGREVERTDEKGGEVEQMDEKGGEVKQID